MFQISGSAYDKLNEIIQIEQKDTEEKLYVRLSMGVG
jgi:hypothetical protein